jgi:hypothetical protein
MSTATEDPRGRLSARILAIWMLGMLGLGIFGLFLGLALGVRGGDVVMLGWAIATFWLCMIPLGLDRARPTESRHIIFSMMSLMFLLRFVLPVLTRYIPAKGPVDSPDLPYSALTPQDVAYAQALFFMGWAVLSIGYAIPLGRAFARQLPKPRFDWTENSSLGAALVLIFFGWVFFLATQFQLLPKQLGSGLIGSIGDATLFGPAILAVSYLRYRSQFWLLLLLILIPITSGFNFFTGQKRLVLAAPATAGLSWIVFERRIHRRWFILGLGALLLLYPASEFYRDVILQNNTLKLADAFRNPGRTLDALGDFASSSKGSEYLEVGLEATGIRLDGVGHAAVIIRDTPKLVPFQRGRTLALIPIAFVPRLVWPDKPSITIGAWVIDNYRVVGETVDSSIGPTWVGELYLNFGVWAIPPGMFLLGILLRFAHESLVGRARTSLTLVIEAILIVQLCLKLTGSLGDLIARPVFTIIPILAVHYFIRFIGGVRPIDGTEQSEASGSPNSGTALR